jgi:hypothetical protein
MKVQVVVVRKHRREQKSMQLLRWKMMLLSYLLGSRDPSRSSTLPIYADVIQERRKYAIKERYHWNLERDLLSYIEMMIIINYLTLFQSFFIILYIYMVKTSYKNNICYCILVNGCLSYSRNTTFENQYYL